MFEGAGDVLLGKGSKFTLLNIPFKYNSRVKFIPFPFVLNRRTEPDNTQYDNFIKSVADILRFVSGKTLMVIWKDFKTTEVLSEIPNDKYTEKLKESLISSGIPESAFSVTYYGAADTKSCNDYREYENIILAGRWILGKTVVRKLETAFLKGVGKKGWNLKKKSPNILKFNKLGDMLVIGKGFEPLTHSLEGCCSIQLSYPTYLNCFLSKAMQKYVFLNT